ncbi:MAG: VTT domain-containing protein, partial [Verrucomicrobia bacterium]|nr:VTT domain-containing protein [Verrucomicrobiota bacterium]
PATQAATLGLLTFVQEDVPTVTAALLASAGQLAWAAGFAGVFLGIWLGDALLYLLARGVGRPLLQYAWTKRFVDLAVVARSEQWFAERGTWLLVSSRFVPGTRLPTYLAAGFLRLPFAKFLLVTGSAVAVWTIGIFVLAQTLGPNLLNWLQHWNSSGWTVLFVVVLSIVGIRLTAKLFPPNLLLRFRIALLRWTRWEFWPAWLFYAPVVLNYVWLVIRYRGVTLPTAANPGIFSGGFVGESKIATLRDLQATSPEFTAEAHLLAGSTKAERLASLHGLCEQRHLDFPFILKPDIGQRGVGVKLIRSPEQASAYLEQTNAPLLVQKYASGPHEIGVFYYRFPHEARGCVFAITEKIFPTITGDGRRTIEELVWQDERARFMAEKYLVRFGNWRSEVLAVGETIKLVEAGNHAQGCIFQDGARLWSEELARRIDDISRRLDAFFIGRYDIRYASEDDLRAGRNFQIIELNGAASEATSIYDARNSIFAAYRTLFRQWQIVFAIGAANRQRGATPTKVASLWRAWRENTALVATYPLAD